MLYTNLKHIETVADFERIIDENEFVMIICGRMGVHSIPVYRIAEALLSTYPQVKFFDMESDNPESKAVCDLFIDDETARVPYVVCYRNGEVVFRTSGTKTRQQMVEIIQNEFKTHQGVIQSEHSLLAIEE